MHPPRKVPGIAQQPQSFQPDTRSAISSPLAQPPQQPPARESESDLAQEIYCRLAVDHIRSNQTSDLATLRDLAISANQAALAYFEVVTNAQA